MLTEVVVVLVIVVAAVVFVIVVAVVKLHGERASGQHMVRYSDCRQRELIINAFWHLRQPGHSSSVRFDLASYYDVSSVFTHPGQAVSDGMNGEWGKIIENTKSECMEPGLMTETVKL